MPISKTRYIRTPTGIIRYDNNFDDDQVHMLELSLQGIRGEAEDPSTIDTEDNYHHDKFIITKKCIGLELAENTADKDKNVATARTLKTARNITIGLSTKSFDGSEDLNYSLSSIGAFPADGGILTGNITRTSFKNGNTAIRLNNTNSNISCDGIGLSGFFAAIDINKSRIGIELGNFSDYGIRISCDNDDNSAIPILINKTGSNAAIWINNSSSNNGIVLSTSGEIKGSSNYVVTGSKVYNYCKDTYLPLTGGDVSGAIRIGSSLTSNSNEQLLIGNNLKTTTGTSYQKLIIGKYNTPIGDDIFEIGWGTSDDNRSNLLRVAYDGCIHLGNTDYNSYIAPWSMQLADTNYGRLSGVYIDGRDYGYLSIKPTYIKMSDESWNALWELSGEKFETYIHDISSHFNIKINSTDDLCLLNIENNRIRIGDYDTTNLNTCNVDVILVNSDLVFDHYDNGEVIIRRDTRGLKIQSSSIDDMRVSIEEGDLHVSNKILFGNYSGIITSESIKVNCSTAYQNSGSTTISEGRTIIGSTYYPLNYPRGNPIYLINPVYAISDLISYGTTTLHGNTTIYTEADSNGVRGIALDVTGGVAIEGNINMSGHIAGSNGGSFYADGNVYLNCHGYSGWLTNILDSLDARLRNGGL